MYNYIKDRKDFILESRGDKIGVYGDGSLNIFGNLFKSIGRSISFVGKKGKIYAYLNELKRVIENGQKEAIKNEKAYKKWYVYSSILELKELVNSNQYSFDKHQNLLDKTIKNLKNYKEQGGLDDKTTKDLNDFLGKLIEIKKSLIVAESISIGDTFTFLKYGNQPTNAVLEKPLTKFDRNQGEFFVNQMKLDGVNAPQTWFKASNIDFQNPVDKDIYDEVLNVFRSGKKVLAGGIEYTLLDDEQYLDQLLKGQIEVVDNNNVSKVISISDIDTNQSTTVNPPLSDDTSDVSVEREEVGNQKRLYDLYQSIFPNDEYYTSNLKLSEKERKELLKKIKIKVSENPKETVNPVKVVLIFNKASEEYTEDDIQENQKSKYDSLGRNKKLFKIWNKGVMELIEKYNEYISPEVKSFMIEMLDNNQPFNRGIQRELLVKYFGADADLMTNKKSSRTNTFSGSSKEVVKDKKFKIITKDRKLQFKPTTSLYLTIENAKNTAFILDGNIENSTGELSEDRKKLVCFYMGVHNNDYIIFKFKVEEQDYLNTYSNNIVIQKEADLQSGKKTVYFGLFKKPKNNLILINDIITFKFAAVNDLNNIRVNSAKIVVKNLYMLLGKEDDGMYQFSTPNVDPVTGDRKLTSSDINLLSTKLLS